jgi:hypothetical protein
MLVSGEYKPAIEPSSPAAIARDVNPPVARFREISVPIDAPVVPYAHSIPALSAIHGELMTSPAGAFVDERIPGDAIVAFAGRVGQSGTLSEVAVMSMM